MATSNAYDFSLFEEKQEAAAAAVSAPAAEPKKKKANVLHLTEKQLRRSHRHNAHSLRTMLNLGIVLVIVASIGAVVFSQVQLTELTEQINNTNEALSEQRSIAVQLEMMAASKMNTDEVETYARERLGMEKVSEGQTTYISLQSDDAGTVVQENGSGGFLAGLWESLRSIFS